ncbi:hypothetical protein PIB30_102737 [Stylosanthes scabra]|uniref:Uncharacterized protein n=1 Tax=Stylosanthes scabra TaxID=79078 RepID=A0ABU6X0D6_9FABA|nr:hypothetical protein [Stylosanthes scabra]
MENANGSLRNKMDRMQYERKTNHNGHVENGRRMDELGKCGDEFGKGNGRRLLLTKDDIRQVVMHARNNSGGQWDQMSAWCHGRGMGQVHEMSVECVHVSV